MAHYVGEVSEHAVIVNGEGRILLLRHAGPGSQRGLSHLPGGRMEMDEQPGRALRREIAEETGLTGVEIILPCSATRWGTGDPVKYSVAYLARVAGVPVPALPPHEDHEAAEWVTPEEALSREFIFPTLKEAVAEVIRWARVLKVL